MPTVSNDAVTISGTLSRLFSIIVRGPGKNTSINFLSNGVMSLAILSTIFILETCNINGLSLALPLAINIFFTASEFKPFAPIP